MPAISAYFRIVKGEKMETVTIKQSGILDPPENINKQD
jgi:hypothetical protein